MVVQNACFCYQMTSHTSTMYCSTMYIHMYSVAFLCLYLCVLLTALIWVYSELKKVKDMKKSFHRVSEELNRYCTRVSVHWS